MNAQGWSWKDLDEARTLAEWLEARMKSGPRPMTLRQIATYVGVSPTTIKNILDGGRTEEGTILKLAQWSGEPFDKLLRLSRLTQVPRAAENVETTPPEVVDVVEALQRDPYLRPQVREWLEEIIREEYYRQRNR